VYRSTPAFSLLQDTTSNPPTSRDHVVHDEDSYMSASRGTLTSPAPSIMCREVRLHHYAIQPAAKDAPTPAETATPVSPPQTLRHRPKKSKRSPQEIAFDSIKASTQFHAPGDMPSDSAQEPDSVSASNSVGGPVPEIQLDSAAASPTAAADQSTAAAVAAPRPDMRATLDNFRMLRSLQGSPSPLWIIAGPLLQV